MYFGWTLLRAGRLLRGDIIWAFFIHISFLRYWQPGLGLENWRTFALRIKAILMRQETAIVHTKPWKVLSALHTPMGLVS